MPEGPELAVAAAYIRRICNGKVFSRIQKSAITKCQPVPWNDGDQYSLSAVARGKELMVCMNPAPGAMSNPVGPPEPTTGASKRYVLFHFGMSGRFAFTAASELPKHAHLSFVTADHSKALSFVDTRRFGKWEVKNSSDDWSQERGPCALTEYQQFRDNIAKSINDSIFDRPLCEAMLDQRYFNGIGNYLRAEIIYRAGVQPFAEARTVLQPIIDGSDPSATDLLSLCRTLQEEAIALETVHYESPDHHLQYNYKAFETWLQCYMKSTMNQLRDANRRLIYFSGPAGPLAKRAKNRMSGMVKKRKKELTQPSEEENGSSTTAVTIAEESATSGSRMRVQTVEQVKKSKRGHSDSRDIKVDNEPASVEESKVIGVTTRSRAKLLSRK